MKLCKKTICLLLCLALTVTTLTFGVSAKDLDLAQAATLAGAVQDPNRTDPNLGRKLTEEEYDDLVDYAIRIGITNGFIQDGETASQSYIPAFDGTGL